MSRRTQRQGVCPNCKADSHISYSKLKDQYDPDVVYFDVKCHNCGTTWDEHYSLVFFEQDNIQIPSQHEHSNHSSLRSRSSNSYNPIP